VGKHAVPGGASSGEQRSLADDNTRRGMRPTCGIPRLPLEAHRCQGGERGGRRPDRHGRKAAARRLSWPRHQSCPRISTTAAVGT